jgi:transposase
MSLVLHYLLLEKKMMKIPKQQYTFEFKLLAVKRILAGEPYELVAKELGMSSQTLRYWVKASHEGRLSGGSKAVTPEQMELSRLRAENVRLKREAEILKKATAYFARELA